MRVLLVLAAVFFGTAGAIAQPGPMPITSIESTVLSSETIYVATITEVQEKRDQFGTPVVLKVQELLKGKAGDSAIVRFPQSKDKLDAAAKKKTRFLVMLYGGDQPTLHRCCDLDALERPEPKADYTFIRKGSDLLAYVRDLARRDPNAYTYESFRLPVPEGKAGDAWLKLAGGDEATRQSLPGLSVPIDANLERWAQTHIESADGMFAAASVNALAHFKSDRNIQLIKTALKSNVTAVVTPAESNKGIEISEYWVRRRAGEILKEWGVEFDAPELTTTIERYQTIDYLQWEGPVTPGDLELLFKMPHLKTLVFQMNRFGSEEMAVVARVKTLTELTFWGNEGLKDADFEPLASLPHLETISVMNVPLTNKVVEYLAKIKSLKKVSLIGTEVNDEGVGKLKSLRPDITVEGAGSAQRAQDLAVQGDAGGLAALLTQKPSLIEDRDSHGNTLLHIAVQAGQLETARLLLDRGIDVNAANDEKETAFAMAAGVSSPNVRVLWLLLDRGANVNSVDKDGNTPLHLAMLWGTYASVPLLVRNGANLFAKNDAGQTPINTENRVPEDTKSWVMRMTAEARKPPRMVPLVKGECPKAIYQLMPGSLNGLTSETTGRLVGELTWSKSPKGRDFLGPFNQQKVALNLKDLPKHGLVTVEVELFVIGSWDGNGDGEGPDLIDISVGGLGALMHSSFFSNADDGREGLRLQSYPDPYLVGFHRGYTGAAEARTLGFPTRNSRDAVYKMSFTFAHSGDLELALQGLTVAQANATDLLQDEHWGIAGLTVRID
jgi:hypothetical protein